MTPDKQGGSLWRLRMADGKTYGPVTLDVLVSWAAQARVGPGTQVSSDGTTWVVPETIPELGLEWMVLIRNRQPYGPLSQRGVVQLARDGAIAPETQVVNSRTRDEKSVRELVAMAAADKPVGLPTHAASADSKAANVDQDGVEERKRLGTELERLHQEALNARSEARQFRDEADRERVLREGGQAEWAGRERSYQARTTALEGQLEAATLAASGAQAWWRDREAELTRRIGEIGGCISDLEAKVATSQIALQERNEQCRQLGNEVAVQAVGLTRRIEALTAERDAALAQVAAERTRIEQERAQEVARWGTREVELRREAEEARNALQGCDNRSRSLLAEQAEQIAALKQMVETVAAQREVAVRQVEDLQAEVARQVAASGDEASQRDEAVRVQSLKLQALETEIGRLTAALVHNRKEHDQVRNEGRNAEEQRNRQVAEMQRQLDVLGRELSETQAAKGHVVKELEAERDRRIDVEAKAAERLVSSERQIAELEQEIGRLVKVNAAAKAAVPGGSLFRFAVTCPACRSQSVSRVTRAPWMRLLVVSRRYICDDCGCGFVTFFGFIKSRLRLT